MLTNRQMQVLSAKYQLKQR